MGSNELNVYMPVVILMGTAFLMVVLGHLVSVFLSPKLKDKFQRKEVPYECGELPIGSAWSAYNVRFYVVGLIFIIFDVESVLMFPVASVFKKLNEIGYGGIVLIELLIFIFILVAGVAYCWRKGDLDWVKSYRNSLIKKRS